MLSARTLELIRCPHCHDNDLRLGHGRQPAIECVACETVYPIIDGIPDLVPPTDQPEPGLYRTETFSNLIAGIYDSVMPLMSMALWQCSPLHWVDSENRALGRANNGVYLRAPVGTGLILDRALAPYHDMLVLGIDRSWNMLRQAQKRLEGAPHPVQLMRVDYANLPFRDDVIDSIQSFNGLQIFQQRVTTLKEFKRCLTHRGHLSGSTLVRGQDSIADRVFDRYERSGFYPMLRTPEFLLKDFDQADLPRMSFETRGAVMFFTGEPKRADVLALDNAGVAVGGDAG